MRLTRSWRRNNNSTVGGKDGDHATTMSQRKVMTSFALKRPISSRLVAEQPSTSLTNSTQTGSSKENHSQTGIKESELGAEKAHMDEEINDQEVCLLFHDDSHSNDHGAVENGDGNDGVENDNLSVNVEQLMKQTDLVAPATPNSRYLNGNCATGPPSSLFLPPREVTIDPYAVPPSPMRDPSVAFVAQQEDHGLLLNLGNLQHHCAQQHCPLQDPEVLGDPVGDIAMRRQLMDAQRLVRVILGKPLSGGDHQPLETSNILHAIRSFALMKQELINLRKRQEVTEGDPPSILQTLGSPATSASTTNGTKTPRTATSANPSPRMAGHMFGLQIQQDDSNQNSPTSESSAVIALKEARTQIVSLELQLAAANETILKLQTENSLRETKQADSATVGAQVTNSSAQQQEVFELNLKYKSLLVDHRMSVDESKRKLDLVLEEVASVPKRVLAKDSIREKLKEYVQTITQQTNKLEQIELHAELLKSQEESQARIHALEERLRRQEENHQQELAMLKGTSDSAKFKEHILPSTESSKGGGGTDGNFSRTRELQGRLFEPQREVEILTQQIQDSQSSTGFGTGEAKGIVAVHQEHLVLKEFSQNRKGRTTNVTARPREMEDEKKIDL